MEGKNDLIGLKIIYNTNNMRTDNQPLYIRDENGILVAFPNLSYYEGQEARYDAEIKEQNLLAKSILSFLQNTRASQPEAEGKEDALIDLLKDVFPYVPSMHPLSEKVHKFLHDRLGQDFLMSPAPLAKQETQEGKE
jgi:hypothetical protein